MINYLATGISRKQIRAFAKYIRKLCGLENVVYFPVVEFLENVLPKLVEGFSYEYVSVAEMPDKEGETTPSCNLIKIREDVYEKAVSGDGRARFTILHEIGHLLLHDNDSIVLCRTTSHTSVKIYENPEWQADAFAGELLMAEHLIKSMSIDSILEKCGASYAAATCQYKQIRR